ncbi:MAG: hypothetical protein US64_C0005G0046, partial [Candidatus Nomurabacteria bacterium GW2011_GWC1_37_9]
YGKTDASKRRFTPKTEESLPLNVEEVDKEIDALVV